jgi:hypothetical protein
LQCQTPKKLKIHLPSVETDMTRPAWDHTPTKSLRLANQKKPLARSDVLRGSEVSLSPRLTSLAPRREEPGGPST